MNNKREGRGDLLLTIGVALAALVCCGGGVVLLAALITTGLGSWLLSQQAVLAGVVAILVGAALAVVWLRRRAEPR